jgi:hypothetical protein
VIKMTTMNTTVVEGTLRPDGTLELDEKPSLAPGRVRVTLTSVNMPATAPKARGLADTIDEIRQRQQARGYVGRTEEEMAQDIAERQADEDEYERRMREVYSQTKSGD